MAEKLVCDEFEQYMAIKVVNEEVSDIGSKPDNVSY